MTISFLNFKAPEILIKNIIYMVNGINLKAEMISDYPYSEQPIGGTIWLCMGLKGQFQTRQQLQA